MDTTTTTTGQGCQLFFGKYRGTVENNLDVQGLGRVQVSVPAVLGDTSMAWAMPSSPYAGPGVGFFAVPPNGARVWVEFEGGDPDYPIWSGCFWELGQVPAAVPGPTQIATKMLKTDAITLTLNDLAGAGGLKLEVGPPAVAVPATIEVTSTGVSIAYATARIELTAAGVDVNSGALKVLP